MRARDLTAGSHGRRAACWARWAAVDRPAALRLQVLVVFVVGVALLVIAAVIGLS